MDYKFILDKLKLSDIRFAIKRAKKINHKEEMSAGNSISIERRFLEVSKYLKKYKLTLLKVECDNLSFLKSRIRSAIFDCSKMIEVSAFLEKNANQIENIEKFEHDNEVCNYFFYKEFFINHIYGNLKSKIYEFFFVKYLFIKNIKYKKAVAKNDTMNQYISYITNNRFGNFFGDGEDGFSIIGSQKNLIKMYPCLAVNSVIYSIFFIIDIVLIRRNMIENVKYKDLSCFYIANSYINHSAPYSYMKDTSDVIEESKNLKLIDDAEVFQTLMDAMKFESTVLRSYYKPILQHIRSLDRISDDDNSGLNISSDAIEVCYRNIEKKNRDILKLINEKIDSGNYNHQNIAFDILFSMFLKNNS